MTTAGADKAEELAEECNKVTSAPHSACKIQEKACDEIKAAIKKGCDGLAASAPDFCSRSIGDLKAPATFSQDAYRKAPGMRVRVGKISRIK